MNQDDLTVEQKTFLWGGPRLAAVGSADWTQCRLMQAKGLMIQGTRFAAGEAASDMFHLTRKGMELQTELRYAGGGIRPAPSLQVDVVPANPFPPASRWVPVEERLPEPSVTVSVLRDWAHVSKDRRLMIQGGLPYWTFDNLYPNMPVTHWLEEVVPPLPERPKEKVPEPPGKWVRWGIGECRNRARTGERYVGVSAADGAVKDIVWMAGIRGEEHFADIHQGGRAALPAPGWIIREEDFLALCPGPWSEGKGEA